MPSAIRTENLSKTYSGGVQALKSLDLEVMQGESFGYLGPNGAGKTTTIQIILNLIRPTEGQAFLFGENMLGQEKRMLRNIGALVEIPGHYEYLTPNDLLKHICKTYRMPRGEINNAIDTILETLKIREVKNTKIGTFSTGMKRRVSLAQALVHDPELLILDEPTIGLDPKGVREIRNLIKDMNKNGKTIFLTSHNLSEVSEISDRVVFLNSGVNVRDINLVDIQTQLSSKQIDLKFLEELNTSQRSFIEGLDGITDVSFGKLTVLNYKGTTDDTHRILSEMMNNDIPVYSYTPRSMTLEDLYLDIFGEGEEE